MAEGWAGGCSPYDVDVGRDQTLDKKEYKELQKQFETYPRLRLMGLDWFIPKKDR